MKFVISLFFSLTAYAGPIRLYHEGDPNFALGIKGELLQEYQIPEELILIKKVGTCEKLNKKGRLDLCLKNNGDLILVSVDREFVSESLRIFRAP